MIIFRKDKDDKRAEYEFFFKVASKESAYDSYYESDSEYDSEERERWKNQTIIEKKAPARAKKWEEGGKEGECVFTRDCEVVTSSLSSSSLFISVIAIIKGYVLCSYLRILTVARILRTRISTVFATLERSNITIFNPPCLYELYSAFGIMIWRTSQMG